MKKLNYKYIFLKISVLIFLAVSISCTEKQNAVPKELFGIKLGNIYNLGDGSRNSVGNLPIKKIGGIEASFTIGQHLYFQPLSVNPKFEYTESKKNSWDEYFTTTYRLYLLPVIPKSIESIDELKNLKFDTAEIALISWSNKLKDDSAAYYWAVDMCKTFEADIGKKSESHDDYKLEIHSCAFRNEDRILNINNIGDLVSFELKYAKEIFDKKIDDIDSRIRKIQAKEILK
jgi:hypothetical protein